MLSTEQKQFFDLKGFLVVERFVQGKLLEDLRAESEMLAAAEYFTQSRRVWHERALFRRKAFRDLLDAPGLFEIVCGLVGEDAQLLALDLLVAKPGTGGIGWHRDVTFVCNKTLSMNTGIYLQDMTEEMGPLRVIPGSHRWEDKVAKGSEPHPEEVLVPVPAGSAVFFDAGLFHSGGPNRSIRNRLAVFPYFGRYWIKRMDNFFTQPLPADLLLTKDPKKQQLLGLGLRPGVPSYHGDDEGYNRSRGEPGIDFALEKQEA